MVDLEFRIGVRGVVVGLSPGVEAVEEEGGVFLELEGVDGGGGGCVPRGEIEGENCDCGDGGEEGWGEGEFVELVE